jgi:phage FluMu gp28-like protein
MENEIRNTKKGVDKRWDSFKTQTADQARKKWVIDAVGSSRATAFGLTRRNVNMLRE